jgi:hypothetical protein
VAGCCVYGNEPSASIKCRGFIEILASQEELCSMELVTIKGVYVCVSFKIRVHNASNTLLLCRLHTAWKVNPISKLQPDT